VGEATKLQEMIQECFPMNPALDAERVRNLLKADPEAVRANFLRWEQQSIKLLRLEKHAD
jgi:hypothetical protein